MPHRYKGYYQKEQKMATSKFCCDSCLELPFLVMHIVEGSTEVLGRFIEKEHAELFIDAEMMLGTRRSEYIIEEEN